MTLIQCVFIFFNPLSIEYLLSILILSNVVEFIEFVSKQSVKLTQRIVFSLTKDFCCGIG
jgi:hypothetical protein